METYIVSGTGFASGVNRPKEEDDAKLEKLMEEVILKATDEGCDVDEMRRRIREAHEQFRKGANVPV